MSNSTNITNSSISSNASALLYGIPPIALREGYPSNQPIEFCNRVSPGLYETPTTCYEAKSPKIQESLETAVLYAEGMNSIVDLVYPTEVRSLYKSLVNYDEPVYPLPLGVSIYFFIMIGWVVAFYFTHLGRKLFYNFIFKLDLYPEANRFPDIPLYWLQQTKKESEQRGKGRNTWAWLARRYVLSPDDPLLANVDEKMTWNDFELSRNTQSLIDIVLKENGLFLKVKRGEEGRRQFEVVRAEDMGKVPMNGDRVRRIFMEQGQGRSNKDILQSNEIKAQQLEKELEGEPNQGLIGESMVRGEEISSEPIRSRLSPPPSNTVISTDEPTHTPTSATVKSKKKGKHATVTSLMPDKLATPAHSKPIAATASKKKKGDKNKMQKPSKQGEIQEKNTADEIPSQFPLEQKEELSIKPAEQTGYQPESRTELKWELPPLTQPVQEGESKLDAEPGESTSSLRKK